MSYQNNEDLVRLNLALDLEEPILGEELMSMDFRTHYE